ncbi:MAG TPA: hypothetical protein VEF34_00690 [Syntrophobacteraceae bacterium]|nr:hypothetical protein [Syntrophobacteraceae bacterium]
MSLLQLDEVIRLAEHPVLPARHKEQMLKSLKSLSTVVHTAPAVEEKATKIVLSLRPGTRLEDPYPFGIDLPGLKPGEGEA